MRMCTITEMRKAMAMECRTPSCSKRVLSKPGREGKPRAWILAWDQMPRPDFTHPDIPVGHLSFWRYPSLSMQYPHRLS